MKILFITLFLWSCSSVQTIDTFKSKYDEKEVIQYTLNENFQGIFQRASQIVKKCQTRSQIGNSFWTEDKLFQDSASISIHLNSMVYGKKYKGHLELKKLSPDQTLVKIWGTKTAFERAIQGKTSCLYNLF